MKFLHTYCLPIFRFISPITFVPLSNPLTVLFGWYKNTKLKKNNFYWSLYSSLFGSLSYLKITLGIAMHCQHCNIIANRAPHSVIYFLHTAHKYSAFIPPFLRNHIICLFSSCCPPTLLLNIVWICNWLHANLSMRCNLTNKAQYNACPYFVIK
jgi:hypothetical protein